MTVKRSPLASLVYFMLCVGACSVGRGADGDTDATPPAASTPSAADDAKQDAATSEPKPEPKPELAAPKGMVRLSKEHAVWMDPKRKLVVVDGVVVLREGQLEMFACPKGTKEHESIVAVDSKAWLIHAALLAVGAQAGKPVQYDPEYAPAKGPEVEISVLWKDADGKKHRARAQDWVRYEKTGEAMPFPWVFGGSSFWVDPQSGERHYQAEAGDLICLSNFTTAMLDVPVESSDAAAEILFTAFTEKIPAKGTKVRLVLSPILPKNSGTDPKKAQAVPAIRDSETAPAPATGPNTQ